MIPKKHSLEGEVIEILALARIGTKKIPTLIPTNYKFIHGKYSPTNFKKGVKYVPVYKRLKISGITSI